jgi:penicillin-binding protein 1C
LPATVTALLTDILDDTGSRAPAFGLDNALRLPFAVAAKTGTSKSYVDNWTAGFTHERTVAVWAGNFDGTPMRGVSGISGAGSIFARVMERAMEGLTPASLVDTNAFDDATVCPLSGKRAGPHCVGAVHEHYLRGTAPRETCDMHHTVASTSRGCAGPRQTVTDVGPAWRAWAHGEGLADDTQLHCDDDDTPPVELTLLSPVDDDEYALEPGVPHDHQMVPVRVQVPAGHTGVVSVVDERGQSTTLRAPWSTWIEAPRGDHVLTLLDAGRAVGRAHYHVQ